MGCCAAVQQSPPRMGSCSAQRAGCSAGGQASMLEQWGRPAVHVYNISELSSVPSQMTVAPKPCIIVCPILQFQHPCIMRVHRASVQQVHAQAKTHTRVLTANGKHTMYAVSPPLAVSKTMLCLATSSGVKRPGTSPQQSNVLMSSRTAVRVCGQEGVIDTTITEEPGGRGPAPHPNPASMPAISMHAGFKSAHN